MFRVMDEMEIEISMIDNLKMVHIYELTGAEATVGTSGCTAIAVYYGDEGKMNISDFDAHFTLLVNRVVELYGRADNKELIMMDDNTRSLLEAGVATRHEKEIEFFYSIQPVEYPQIPNESILNKRFLPLAEYLVVGLNKVLDINLTVIKRRLGWRGVAAIWLNDGTKEKMMSVRVEQRDAKKYLISVSEFFEGHIALFIEVTTDFDGMYISFESTDKAFVGTGSYKFGAEYMLETYDAYYQDKQIFFDEEQTGTRKITPEYELSDHEARLIMNDRPVHVIYSLPWNARYILLDDFHADNSIETYSFTGVYMYEDFTEHFGWTDIFNQSTNTRLRIESLHLCRLRLSDGRLQTKFMPVASNSTGEYKLKLADRYFIH